MKKIGLLFTGYGQQYVTMAKDVYDESRVMQDLFEQASLITGINYVKLIFAESEAELSGVVQAYTSLYLVQCGLYDVMKEQGLCPEFVAGYGIGEYAAVYAAGGLSFEDGLYLIHKYANFVQSFVQDLQRFEILRIPRSLQKEDLDALLATIDPEKDTAFVVSHDAPGAWTLGGTKRALTRIQNVCDKKFGIKKMKRLPAGHGLHNPIMQPVVDQLSPYFHKIVFKNLRFPLITNVDATYITTGDSTEAACLRRIVEPILWHEVMDGFIDCDVLVSVGPGDQLKRWNKIMYPDKNFMTVITNKDIAAVAEHFDDEPNCLQHDIAHGQKTLFDVDVVNESKDDDDDE